MTILLENWSKDVQFISELYVHYFTKLQLLFLTIVFKKLLHNNTYTKTYKYKHKNKVQIMIHIYNSYLWSLKMEGRWFHHWDSRYQKPSVCRCETLWGYLDWSIMIRCISIVHHHFIKKYIWFLKVLWLPFCVYSEAVSTAWTYTAASSIAVLLMFYETFSEVFVINHFYDYNTI